MSAASAAVAPLLLGAPQPVEVTAVLPAAVYLTVPARPGTLLALLAPGSVRLPIGVVVGADRSDRLGDDPWVGGPRVGQTGTIGAGRLRVGGHDVRPVRWWDPAVRGPAAVPPAAVARLAAELEALPAWSGLPGGCLTATARLAGALAHADGRGDRRPARAGAAGDPSRGRIGRAVAALAGLGPGLTPAGDDVLAGALIGLTVLAGLSGRRPVPSLRSALAAAVVAASGRTTPLSAALLREAAAGHAVPQVHDVLAALGTARSGGTVRRLAAVGHTSGVAIGLGLVTSLRLAGDPREGHR